MTVMSLLVGRCVCPAGGISFSISYTGGTGNDSYVVDNAGDVVVENWSAGFAAPSGWTIKGTADFNSDGQIDVVASNGTLSAAELRQHLKLSAPLID